MVGFILLIAEDQEVGFAAKDYELAGGFFEGFVEYPADLGLLVEGGFELFGA